MAPRVFIDYPFQQWLVCNTLCKIVTYVDSENMLHSDRYNNNNCLYRISLVNGRSS